MFYDQKPRVKGEIADLCHSYPACPEDPLPEGNQPETRRSDRLAKKRRAPKNRVQKRTKTARSKGPLASSPTTAKAVTGLPHGDAKKKRITIVVKNKTESFSPAPISSLSNFNTTTVPVVRKPRIVIKIKETVKDGKLFYRGKPVSPVSIPAYADHGHQSNATHGSPPTNSSPSSSPDSTFSTNTERGSPIGTPPTVPGSSTSPERSSDEHMVKADGAMEIADFSKTEENKLLGLANMVELALMAKKFPDEAKEWGLDEVRIAKGKRNKMISDAEESFTDAKTIEDAERLFTAHALCSLAHGQ